MQSPKKQIARRLAQFHFKAEPNLQAIFLLEPTGSEDDETVRLLEVVDGSVATDIFAVGFAPDPGAGIPYRSVIVEVSPREFAELKSRGSVRIRSKEWKIGEKLVRDEVVA